MSTPITGTITFGDAEGRTLELPAQGEISIMDALPRGARLRTYSGPREVHVSRAVLRIGGTSDGTSGGGWFYMDEQPLVNEAEDRRRWHPSVRRGMASPVEMLVTELRPTTWLARLMGEPR